MDQMSSLDTRLLFLQALVSLVVNFSYKGLGKQ
jgi:hypothetical protein